MSHYFFKLLTKKAVSVFICVNLRPIKMPLKTKTIALSTLLFATFIIAYFPVWKNLVHTWSTSDEYSHGFLIIPINCFILWQKRKILAEIPAKPSRWGLVIAISALLLYLFANSAEISTLSSLSMLPVLAGIIIYIYGFSMFKEFLFPLFLLLFMIPVPSQIYSALTVPLQLFVSKIGVDISNAIGITVFREGNVIYLPDHRLQVVQACSGLRSLISLLTLCVVFGYFTLKSNFSRGVLFLCGIPTAIFVNIIRVLLILLAFYYFNFDLTEGVMHTIFGMIIFILALGIITSARGLISVWEKSTLKN